MIISSSFLYLFVNVLPWVIEVMSFLRDQQAKCLSLVFPFRFGRGVGSAITGRPRRMEGALDPKVGWRSPWGGFFWGSDPPKWRSPTLPFG